MPEKPHLYFRNEADGENTFQQHNRYDATEDNETERNYQPLSEVYQSSIDRFFIEQSRRHEERNIELLIPIHIDYIEITFFNYFTWDLENKYGRLFGLIPITYNDCNEKILFAIEDVVKFNYFIENLRNFIETENHTTNVTYNRIIKYIKEFEFLSSVKILNNCFEEDTVYLNIVDSAEIFRDTVTPIIVSLEMYLAAKEISHSINATNSTIEVFNIDNETLVEIVKNFDIIHTVNSFRAGIISPSLFGTPLREYGYTITTEPHLPVVGIIDTGVSDLTPLNSVIINTNNDYDLTGAGSKVDNVDHGTPVANLAVLGKTFYQEGANNFAANARILSIKVLDTEVGNISQKSIEFLVRKANRELDIRIFVLTIGDKSPLLNNCNVSSYGYLLDKLAHDLDILFFISTGNNCNLLRGTIDVARYPDIFTETSSNICSPADSLNNITVGATAENFEAQGTLAGLTPDKIYPAIYTRKHNLSYSCSLLTKTQRNSHLFKPDVLAPGGDFDAQLSSGGEPALKLLSAQTGIYFDKNIGTSYSAPLVANIAAKIIYKYPQLNMQSVKALIVNSSSMPWADSNIPAPLDSFEKHALKRIVGHGMPNEGECVHSNENQITIVIEDSIKKNFIKVFPINLPLYLNALENKRSVIEVKATLCFKFKPFFNNHLVYCPMHVTFGFFKNTNIINRNRDEMIMDELKLKENVSWAEDYYYKGKILSNVQKVKFTLNKELLIDEGNTIKIAINSKVHKLLNPNIYNQFIDNEQPFSLVITLKETPLKKECTGRLYQEITAINNLESISELEAEAEFNN